MPPQFAKSSPIMGGMLAVEQSIYDVPNGVSLRTELSLRSLRFATTHGLLYERTDGQVPSILFGHGEDGRHGNFHELAYKNICANEEWAKRLGKVHTASKRARVRANWQWKELDCANSSDALLMNIFCYPEVMARAGVRAMLGNELNAVPEFGFKPRTPLKGDRRDNTEIDMRVGDLLVEAKLTEPQFAINLATSTEPSPLAWSYPGPAGYSCSV